MRIERVVARAFGPFRGDALDLAPGMNVVAGPNEAGKSTWHAALRLALTGVRRGKGPGTAAERQLAERHRPWDEPDRWEVEARLALDDGRRIDITQDLAGKVACRATDVELGRDVSHEIMDGTPDASRWLGLNRDSFAATVSVSQAQIMSVADAADDLQHPMQRAAATRGTDATAAEAIDRLEQFRRDAIGADTIAAKGPLRTARNRLAAADATLAEANRLHATYLEQGAALDAAERLAATVSVELAALEAGVADEAANRISARLVRAEALAARRPQRPPSIADQHEDARRVDAAVQAWRSRPSLPVLDGPTVAELEARIAALPPLSDGDRRVHPDVAEARHVLEVAREALMLHGEAPSAADSQAGVNIGSVRDLARRLRLPQLPHAAALEEEVERARHAADMDRHLDRRAVAAAVVSALGGAVLLLSGIAAMAAVLLFVSVGLAAFAWRSGTGRRAAAARLHRAEAAVAPYREAARLAQRDREVAAAEARALDLPVDAAALDEIADQLSQRERVIAERDAWAARHASLEARIAAARDALHAALAKRGVDPGDDPQAAFDRYATDCESRAREAEAASQADSIRVELATRRAAEQAATKAARAAAEAEEVLHAAAASVGIEPAASVPATVTALQAWREQKDAQLREGEAAVAEWQELMALLDGTSIDVLRAEVAGRRDASARLLAALAPGTAPAVGEPAAMEARLSRARAELAEALHQSDSLRGSLSARREGVPQVAEAEEAVAAARTELEGVQRLAATIDEALRLLRAAEEQVHRSLSPVLAGAIRRWLPSVSGGAYDEVSVDPSNLGVKVKEAASGQWRPARLLSEGTREQIYLLLRVAMAEHLVTTDERAPLLLDEVTAQSDATRKRQLLEVLHHISLDRQVILFSHDDDVTEWAAANLDSARDRLVRLDRAAAARSMSGDVALEVVPAATDPMPVAQAVPDAART